MNKANLFYKCTRFFLFQFDPEKIHNAISYFIKLKALFSFVLPERLHRKTQCNIRLGDHNLACPIIMAAGFDKNGDMVNGLQTFGFGLTEVGTFTKKIQAGNSKPRLFRIPSHHALFNRMGFNNPGIEKGLENLQKARYPFAISIGKSKETPVENAAEDYTEILKTIENSRYKKIKEKIVYVAINISSPNTPGLRLLQNKKYVKELISQCKKVSNLPLVVKFSPDFSSMAEFENTLTAALKAGIDGVIVTNTTSDEFLTKCVPDDIRKNGGGLSGLPLTKKSEEYLTATLNICKGKIPVISSGGIMSCEDVWKRLQMGATAVQIYTGFIYNGPGFINDCIKYIHSRLRESGCQSLTEYQKKFKTKKR